MKLILNEDGTVGIPLGGPRAGEIVTLREPTLEEIGTLNELARKADAEWDAMTDLDKRNDISFAPEAPYIILFQSIVEMLGDPSKQPIGHGALPAWAAAARTSSAIIAFFTIPLDGEGLDRLTRR